MIEHAPCEICNGQYNEPWRKTYEEFAARQEKWDSLVKAAHQDKEKAMKPAWCNSCKKDWVIPVDALYLDYTCNKAEGGCGKPLWRPPDTPMIFGAKGERVN